MAVMMLVASNPRIMGPLTLPLSMRIGGWSATALMLAAAIGFFL
jgi:Mn2+/Fe2+ NRAMP family transporter